MQKPYYKIIFRHIERSLTTLGLNQTKTFMIAIYLFYIVIYSIVYSPCSLTMIWLIPLYKIRKCLLYQGIYMYPLFNLVNSMASRQSPCLI